MCKVEDESIDFLLGLISKRVASFISEGTQGVSNIVADMLQYAHEKSFGAIHTEEHVRRPDRFRAVVQLLKLTRACVGKTPYEEMRWPFEQCHTKKMTERLRNAVQ